MGVLKRIERRKKSKIKKAMRSYRGRFWKNVAIFMAGVFSSGFIFAGVVAVVLKIFKLSTIAGDNTNKIVSEQLADKSILDVLLGIQNYTTDDLVFVNTLIDTLQNTEVMGKSLGQFISIDKDKLAGVKIFEIGGVIKDAITVTATLESVVGAETLDSFGIGKISAFKNFDPVLKEDGETQCKVSDVDSTADGFNAKLYYYKVEDGVYARAYKDDKSLADGVTAETELYYGAVTKVPVTDAISLIGDTVGRVKASDLLTTFNVSTEGVIGKILGDRTITELGELNADSIYIYDILGGEETSDLYKLLSDATGKPYNEILAGDLTGLDINGIKISTVLDTASQSMKDIFVDLINAEKEKNEEPLITWEEVTIGDMQGISGFESIKLSSVMTTTYPTNYNKGTTEEPDIVAEGSLVADLLIDAKTWDGEKASWTVNQKWDSLTVNDISGISADKIKLKTVLSSTYPTGYKINNVEQTGSLVADLLIDSKTWGGEKASWTVNQKWDSLTVNDISGISADKIKLKTVLSTTYPTDYIKDGVKQTGSLVADLLIDSKTWDGEKAGWTVNQKWDSLTVNDISGISTDNIKLKTVLSTTYPTGYVKKDGTTVENGSTMANILIESKTWGASFDTVNQKWDSLTVNDISNIDFNSVKLSTLGIKANGNKLLETLLEDESVTVSGLGEKINKLSLYDIYGENIFIEGTPTGGERAFKKVGDVYTYVADGVGATHYLSKSAGIWLLLCFDVNPSDIENGMPNTYTKNSITFNDLGGSTITDKFTNATIGELVSAGMIQSTNTAIYGMSLSSALALIGTLSPSP